MRESFRVQSFLSSLLKAVSPKTPASNTAAGDFVFALNHQASIAAEVSGCSVLVPGPSTMQVVLAGIVSEIINSGLILNCERFDFCCLIIVVSPLPKFMAAVAQIIAAPAFSPAKTAV